MPSGVYDHSKRIQQFCKRGHDTFVTGRHRNGHCTACDVEWKREYYLRNLAKNKIRGQENSWKMQGIRNPDGSLFTVVDYDRIYQIQQGRCAICKKHQTEFKTRLSVDHNHETGLIRGLLCRRDNQMIGIVEKLKKDQLLDVTISYLQKENEEDEGK